MSQSNLRVCRERCQLSGGSVTVVLEGDNPNELTGTPGKRMAEKYAADQGFTNVIQIGFATPIPLHPTTREPLAKPEPGLAFGGFRTAFTFNRTMPV